MSLPSVMTEDTGDATFPDAEADLRRAKITLAVIEVVFPRPGHVEYPVPANVAAPWSRQ
ncbi:hypothetical protein MESS2_960020 [Mesorhizobium metallidurans STM 2683]|uniref:Uncharacterized protein n=1 Tax=Mesorhizobium metallidurans STM 2683 TaxID=1297569 RepID=M5EW85_9HYPH|nr:hypothetical protein MESS2_960020 [Mesorhizobium metallidurans STM 2683]